MPFINMLIKYFTKLNAFLNHVIMLKPWVFMFFYLKTMSQSTIQHDWLLKIGYTAILAGFVTNFNNHMFRSWNNFLIFYNINREVKHISNGDFDGFIRYGCHTWVGYFNWRFYKLFGACYRHPKCGIATIYHWRLNSSCPGNSP